MKIQLDTTALTIKIEETVNLGEFMNLIDKLLPFDAWRDFKLETHTVINNWTANPIKIDHFDTPNWNPLPAVQPWEPQPYNQPFPWITCGDTSNGAIHQGQHYTLNAGTYNIDYKK